MGLKSRHHLQIFFSTQSVESGKFGLTGLTGFFSYIYSFLGFFVRLGQYIEIFFLPVSKIGFFLVYMGLCQLLFVSCAQHDNSGNFGLTGLTGFVSYFNFFLGLKS